MQRVILTRLHTRLSRIWTQMMSGFTSCWTQSSRFVNSLDFIWRNGLSWKICRQEKFGGERSSWRRKWLNSVRLFGKYFMTFLVRKKFLWSFPRRVQLRKDGIIGKKNRPYSIITYRQPEEIYHIWGGLIEISVPTFIFGCPLFGAVLESWENGTDEIWWNLGKNGQFSAHLSTFCPLLKPRFGH